jgi:hypothetical protein
VNRKDEIWSLLGFACGVAGDVENGGKGLLFPRPVNTDSRIFKSGA